MATWQARYWLIPTREPTTDPETAWLTVPDASTLLRCFDQVLPPAEAPAADWLHWGTYESHDVQVFLEVDQVAGIRVRIDVREPDVAELLERLAAAGLALDAVFRDEAGRDVRPDPEALADSVRQSAAAHFVRDPVEFLNSLRDRAV